MKCSNKSYIQNANKWFLVSAQLKHNTPEVGPDIILYQHEDPLYELLVDQMKLPEWHQAGREITLGSSDRLTRRQIGESIHCHIKLYGGAMGCFERSRSHMNPAFIWGPRSYPCVDLLNRALTIICFGVVLGGRLQCFQES